MSLVPGSTKYTKREYWAYLLATVLPQAAIRLQEYSPWYVIEFLSLVGMAAVATHRWIKSYESNTDIDPIDNPTGPVRPGSARLGE